MLKKITKKFSNFQKIPVYVTGRKKLKKFVNNVAGNSHILTIPLQKQIQLEKH